MHESEVSESVYLSELILMDCVLSDCRLTLGASTPPPSQQSYAPPSPLLVTSPRIFPFPSPVLIKVSPPPRASRHRCRMITDNKSITFSATQHSICDSCDTRHPRLARSYPGSAMAPRSKNQEARIGKL